jgi:hypothetical protein
MSLLISNISADNFDIQAEKYKKEVLTLGQNAAFLLTPGKDPYFNLYQPDLDTFKVIKLGYFDGKNHSVTKPEHLKKLTVLNEMINTYSANIRITKKYEGSRESFVSENLANAVLGKKFYKGQIIIDEYNKNIPMFWVLNNVEELRALANYIVNNVSFENKNTDLFSLEKPMLVIKILEDPKFETLTDNDLYFLNTYFNIFSLNDKDVKEFFDNAKNKMLDRGTGMANPRIKGETALENIFRQTEKQYGEWKAKDWAITTGVLIAGTSTYSFFKNEINAAGKEIKRLTGLNTLNKKLKGSEDSIVQNGLVKLGLKDVKLPVNRRPNRYRIEGVFNEEDLFATTGNFNGTIVEILD